MALGTNLKFYAIVAKELKLKVRKFLGLIPTFVEVTGEKLVWGTFSPPILNRVNTYKHHHTEVFFIFSLCETMSRRRSIYDVSVWSVFLFYFDHNYLDHLIKIDTLVFLQICSKYALLFLEIKRKQKREKKNNFSRRKISALRCCLAFVWFFLPISV